MRQKKICMLGSFGVGKTSLVARFVHSRYSEKYQTTIGVKIDRKRVSNDGNDLSMLLWDLHGDDEYQRVRPSYLRGMSGYFLVIDGTRAETVDVAEELHSMAQATVGDVPFIALINKSDLADEWDIAEDRVDRLVADGWTVHKTSAKTGRLVNESFEMLAKRILAADASPDE